MWDKATCYWVSEDDCREVSAEWEKNDTVCLRWRASAREYIGDKDAKKVRDRWRPQARRCRLNGGELREKAGQAIHSEATLASARDVWDASRLDRCFTFSNMEVNADVEGKATLVVRAAQAHHPCSLP